MAGQIWTPWEIETLKKLLGQGHALRDITIGSRNSHAIRNKAARLNLIGDGVPRCKWSSQCETTLRNLMEQGWSVRRIAAAEGVLPGYSRNAIQKKASRLKLTNPKLATRIKQAQRFSKTQRSLFRAFLWVRAQNCTPEQMALLWNETHEPQVTQKRVVYHLERLKLKRPWKVVIQMPYSKAKQRRRSDKAVASQQRRWQRYRIELEQNLKEHALELRRTARRNGKHCKQRVCKDCNRRWPAVEPFFVVREKQSRTGRHRYCGHLCRLCQNKHRRERSRIAILPSTHTSSRHERRALESSRFKAS